ncbi:hypothetical protein SELR_17110 [Selenomonas ruminantium subsp. lactilytica TAM6421]|uniref:Uncharacterized protein n=1 Tax=Selenomonas ruminantium subsp. lactilytica (strain NBRC 103574 / TAM6421) TaxID=927704 RepID=I0GRN2_SELRL|nr:DUF3990 domain-containing protein [Selenomonas ruminantium]BAL83419.1 hypothetical protein SELR_17110 [Selenomonas ruminantium subsp. lactilytica TAM6421]
MFLYHGTDLRSANNIRKNGIKLSMGDWQTDFGLGFYLATHKGVAKGRAKQASFRTHQHGAILVYEFDTTDLTILKPNLTKWEDIVLGYRLRGFRYENEMPKHDAIIGPIADGKIAAMLNMLTLGHITEKDFRDGLQSKLPGLQIALKTEKAILSLKLREELIL